MPKRSFEESQISSTPKIAVTAYPFVDHFMIKDSSMKVTKVDLTTSVIDLNYSKSKAEPSGEFVITLGADQNWAKMIRPGDWITIHMSRFDINVENSDGLS